MFCPFCNFDIKGNNDVCPNCKIESSSYSGFCLKAKQLIEIAMDKILKGENPVELLKYSLMLDSSDSFPLKLLGYWFISCGEYDIALHYLKEYNKKEHKDLVLDSMVEKLDCWLIDFQKCISVSL
jgi:hypothetical protein